MLPLLFAVITAFPQQQRVVWDRWPDRKPRTVFEVRREEALVAMRIGRDGKRRQVAAYETDARAVQLLDVTGDGKPEVLVRLSPGNRSTPIEVLRWDGHGFTQLAEIADNAFFYDLDHDGKNEIVSPGREPENDCGAVAGSAYISAFGRDESRKVIDVTVQTQVSPKPLALQYSLFLPDELPRKVRLHVVNGERGGKHRVTRLELDVREFRSDDTSGPPRRIPLRVGRGDEFRDVTVTLPSRCNFLDVTTHGPAGATVAIVIESVR